MKSNVSPPAQQAEDDGEEIDDDVVGDCLPGGGGVVHQLHQGFKLNIATSGEGKKKKEEEETEEKETGTNGSTSTWALEIFPDGIYPEGEIQPYKDEYVCSLSMSLRCSNAMPTVTRGEQRLKKAV